MADFLWPAGLIANSSEAGVRGSGAGFAAPTSGFTRSVSRPGEQTLLTMRFQGLRDTKRHQLRSMIAALRGVVNRVWCPDHSYVQRGSVSAPELLPSATFANGLTDYTMSSVWSGAVNDRTLRATRNSNTGVAVGMIRPTNAVTVTSYRPVAARALFVAGRGPSDGLRLNFGSTAFGSEYGGLTGGEAGMLITSIVPVASSLHFSLGQGITTSIANDFLDVPFMSLAHCAQVDNGPNLVLQSADLNNAAWTKTDITTPSTAVVLPDGSSGTVNTLHENSVSSTTHFLAQDNLTLSAAAQDVCFGVALKAANRNWAQIRIRDNTAATQARANFNANTGVVGTVAQDGTFTELRTFVVDLGNGWYGCFLIARKNTANTNFGARILIATADDNTSFNGLNQDSIYAWRPSLAASGVPFRLTATTSTAYATGQSQNLGGGIYTKGWPASTSGLLLNDDVVQVGGRFLFLNGPVNSDAAGRAWLPVSNTFREAPADSDAVIFNNPLVRCMFEQHENRWANRPGPFTDAEIVLSEAA